MELLFSYGTLQQKNVQLANFSRQLAGVKDRLPGYVLTDITIIDERVIRESGKSVHRILRYTGNSADQVDGTVFELSRDELALADDYEVDNYQRVTELLTSGRRCWIYAAAEEAPAR
jgi:gamma-glutamylcyclotransferase (GGCT)/AIG2-like uncharacterized protein YtfP